jgi:sarcosine oxidase
MGSAVLYHLAQRGVAAIGLDRFSPPHERGSSHGRTRLIREAYYEHPMYVPLVRRAFALWHELEQRAGGGPLFVRTGSLMFGSEESDIVRGTIRSASEFGVPHEVLSARDVRRRFPAFTPLDEMVGVFEPGSGLLAPEAAVSAMLRLAEGLGARVVRDTRVTEVRASTDVVELATGGEPVRARQAVLCAGPWMPELVPGLPAAVERQVMHWFEPAREPELCGPGAMPVSMWQLASGAVFYTMPTLGSGVKAGWHHPGSLTTADAVHRAVSNDEWAAVTDAMRRFAPVAKGPRAGAEVCLYTRTPDDHFILGRWPATPAVYVVSACSGHGFKFAPAIGEIVAEELVSDATSADLAPFSPERFER